MTREFFELWVYLAATPLAGLTLTLLAYAAGWWIYARCRMHPLANPVLHSVWVIGVADGKPASRGLPRCPRRRGRREAAQRPAAPGLRTARRKSQPAMPLRVEAARMASLALSR